MNQLGFATFFDTLFLHPTFIQIIKGKAVKFFATALWLPASKCKANKFHMRMICTKNEKPGRQTVARSIVNHAEDTAQHLRLLTQFEFMQHLHSYPKGQQVVMLNLL